MTSNQDLQHLTTAAAGSLSASAVWKTVPLPEGDLNVLHDISLRIAPGESVSIIGTSGSGKTTLLSLLAGLDLPSRGEIWLDGKALSGTSEDQRAAIRAEAVGFVFQNFQLLPGMTALENVALPLELQGRDGREAARDVLSRVGLSARLHHLPRQLSGGEQQRVALARAFVGRPRILFADEPTGNLDRRTGHVIEDLMFELNAAYGATLVLVTHDEQLAARCQRAVRLEDGGIVT